ncbi:MAG TPA: PilZ domain-containing protein [Candidatus Omnitrophota bacterium]|nr:PilZ domain-containing protein [Candidatus Omnitrophota bacterium]
MDKRDTVRQRASGTGMVQLRDIPIPATLVDVSPGGCKLRLAHEITELVGPLLPCDTRIAFFGLEYDATALWLANGLLGCRFPEQLPLDHVAALMSGGRYPLQ